MNKFFAFIILAFAFSSLAFAGGDERAEVKEMTVNYKNWKFKKLSDDKELELKKAVQGKKLVMVVYFAPWCGNWKNEAPLVSKLYEKYKAHGFDVIAVGEYGTKDEMKNFFALDKSTYTVVVESESGEDREKTSHYEYRKSTGDTRKWGSPWNIFIEPDKINKKGDVLMEKAWVVQGELIEANIEPFIREKLGLSKDETKTALNLSKKNEACEPKTPTTLQTKKP